MNERVIAVTGMTCSHCANAVRAEIGRIPGVSHVDVDVEAGRVTIAADPLPEPATLRAAVEAAGYVMAS
jgi:copper chaperone